MPAKRKPASKRRAVRKPASRGRLKAARPSKPKTPLVRPRKASGPAAQAPQQLSPPIQLMQMLTGFMVSRSICAAAELGIADKLVRGPLYYTELAKAIGANQKTLHRLMRALSSLGVFAEVKPGTYALTPLSELLRSDVPGSMKHMAEMMTTPSHWLPWGRFDEAVMHGISAADKALGKDVFSYYAENPEEGRVFNAAMSNFSAMSAGAIAKAYDFRNFERIIDVGGGHGFLLSTVLRHAPQAQGVLYDLPQVVQGAGEHFADIKDRVRVIGGDFFKAAPDGGDAYLLKHIIHDWDDESCVKILSNIANVMHPEGRVLVCELIVPNEPGPHFSHVMDLNMLAMTPGGCERTEEHFADLFKAAGLKLAGITATQSPVNVIEAIKA